MADVTIFHNPRCSKSRQALALLEERSVPHDVVRDGQAVIGRPTEAIQALLDG